MPFIVSGLSPAPFVPLYGLSDDALATRRARRVVVTGPGCPERVELRDAEPGETLLLVNFEHQPANTPFRSSHAIYVREGATVPWEGSQVPLVLRTRLLSLRAFDAHGMMVDADIVDGQATESLIERLFADREVAYIHAHYARRGCYAARIDRG